MSVIIFHNWIVKRTALNSCIDTTGNSALAHVVPIPRALDLIEKNWSKFISTSVAPEVQANKFRFFDEV